jgi:hypothetical protein
MTPKHASANAKPTPTFRSVDASAFPRRDGRRLGTGDFFSNSIRGFPEFYRSRLRLASYRAALRSALLATRRVSNMPNMQAA